MWALDRVLPRAAEWLCGAYPSRPVLDTSDLVKTLNLRADSLSFGVLPANEAVGLGG